MALPHTHLCDFCKNEPYDDTMTHLDHNSCPFAAAVMYPDDETEGQEREIKAIIGPVEYKRGIPVNKETGNDGEYYRNGGLIFKTEDNGGGYNITVCGLFRLDYRQYLKSDSWKRKKYARLRKDGLRCQMCGTAKNLQVHHITYENFPNEDIEDLVTLCCDCHSKVHAKDIGRKGEGNETD